MKRKFYLLKISLAEIEPEIWRRFVVPSDIPLDRLHDVIQIVMGWFDYHLHEFNIDRKRYTEDLDPAFDKDAKEEERYPLSELVKKKGTQFEYVYDFGDNWRHHLVLENGNYKLGEREDSIICLEGKRACPPEDVGGVPGYEEFCEAVTDKKHPQHDELNEWFNAFDCYDAQFDSEHFNLERVNMRLSMYIRWSRRRLIPWSG